MGNVAISLEYETDRPKAIAFIHPDDLSIIWIPRSKIQNLDDIDLSEVGYHEEVLIVVPEWIAINNGLDSYCEEIGMEEVT